MSYGAWPTGLGFRGFPKSCCTSVNEVVCHGIPDSRPLEEGDIITVDCVAYLGAFDQGLPPLAAALWSGLNASPM